MGHQSWLVVLVLTTCAITIGLCNMQQHLANSIHDDINDNKLEDGSDIVGSIKISTPKVHMKTTTSGSTTIKSQHHNSDEILLPQKGSEKALDESSRLNKMLPETVANPKNNAKNSSKTEEIDDDYYNYDYEDDYSYDETNSAETSKTTASVPVIAAKKLAKLAKLSTTTTTTSTTTTTTSSPASTSITVDKLKPIKGNDKSVSKQKLKSIDDIINDNDEDDDEDDDEYNDEIADEEEIVFNENVPCPRDCICARNVNSYLVATCSRLDPGKQKFGSDITDLVVVDVGPKYPILLGPEFFVKIGLKHVSSIKIANCTIEYLHQDAFHGLDDLYSVNLTNVGLSIINPDTFVNNKKLRMLAISGNDLSVMSSERYLLKSSSIEELDLSRNNLMEVNQNAFSKLSNIVYINLASNNIKKLPEMVFDSVETIEELDLSYNLIKYLPTSIFNRTALAILHLKYNEITGDLRFGSADLQHLDLSFCSIKQVHHGMFDKMEGLTNLNLRGNGITKIQPDSFLTLKNLRHIDLSINELDQVSSLLFYKNSELDVIRLNDNPRLSQLPTDGFQSYTGHFTVYLLDVSNCAIGALGHKTFATMPHLATLRLAWNNINNLDKDTFSTLKKLTELDLSNNLIIKLDEMMFMNNNVITKLNLSGNPIRKLSVRLFSPLNKLRELDVSECELHTLLTESFPVAGRKYKFYETLRTLNASSNQIKKISVTDVKNFVNLRTLDISHNPLKCNEDFQEFISHVSISTTMVPGKVPTLANLESSSFSEFQPHLGWSDLARDICKHHHASDDQANTDSSSSNNSGGDKIPDGRTIEQVQKDLEADSKNLASLIANGKLNKMQKILKDSKNSEVVANKESKLSDAVEGGDVNEPNNADDETGDEDKSEYEYDDDDDDDEDEDDDEYEQGDKNKADDKQPKITDDGTFLEEVNLLKETRDKFLLNKFMLNGDDDDNSQDPVDEIIIERGRIYYSGYKFLVPVIIIVTCIIVLLLAIAKIVSLMMRKRGERYRMALLASKNSIVYQKLSEEIKPQTKQPKQPKVHRYSPINQV